MMNKTEYGKLSLAVSLAAFAAQVFGNPIGQTTTRFFSACLETGKLSGLLRSMKTALSRSIFLIAIVCGITVFVDMNFNTLLSPYFILATGGFAVLLVINRAAWGFEDAVRERRFRACVQTGFEINRFLFAIGFMVVLKNSTAVIGLNGFILAGFVIVAAHWMFFKKKISMMHGPEDAWEPRVAAEDLTQIQHFQIPLIFSNFCMWWVMMSERWMLNCFGTLKDVGGYTAIHQLAFIPMFYLSSVLVILTEPVLYQMIGLDKKFNVKMKAVSINMYLAFSIFVFTLACFLILYFHHSRIADLILGPGFREYSWLFPWLVLAGGCFACAQQILLKLNYEMQTARLAGLWAVIAMIALVFYFAGARLGQLQGVMIAVVAVNALLLILSLFFVVNKKPGAGQ